MKNTFKKVLMLIVVSAGFLAPHSIQLNQENVFTIQTSVLYAQEKVDDSGYLDCSNFDFACKGINLLQIIFVTGGNVLVGLSAFFMDIFLNHSLQSSSYRDSGFIEQGWEILRDITNIIFIFALLYIAFNMVLGSGGSDNKKRLIRVILISLTINFSLFITYTIIDASNILAHVFYNKIEQKEVTYDTSSSQQTNTSGEIKSEEEFKAKSTSLAIAKKINPQRLLSKDVIANPTKGQRVVMVLLAGVINGTLIYVFLSVSFLFLGRTIGLWLSAVLAPLAFASLTVPKMDNLDYIGFGKWFSSLLQMAFMAPVFIFFLYLTVVFMEIDIGSSISPQGDFIQNILNITIPMAAIVVLLLLAKKVANKMSGDFAGVISKFVTKGAMAVGGVALGGAALAARGTLGAVASTVNKSERFKNIVEKSKYGKYLHKGMDRLGSSTFDFRNTKANKMLASTGMKIGGGLSVDKGYTGRQEEKKTKRQTEEKAFQTYLDKKETNITDHEVNGGGKIKASAVEDRILKTEYDKGKKDKKVKDARQDLTDAQNKAKNLGGATVNPATGATYQQEVTDAQTKFDREKSDIKDLIKSIKADKDLLNAGTKKVTDTEGNEFEVAGRTERYVARRQGNSYTAQNAAGAEIQIDNTISSAYGSNRNAGIIGSAIGTVIAPGLGTALGGAIGMALHAAIGKIPQYNEFMSRTRNIIGDNWDGREADRELSRARYKQETKDNKSK